MKLVYKRDANKSFMILEGSAVELGYEEKMLQQNDIESLLTFSTCLHNDETQVWYDITGKKSLADYIEQEGHVTITMLQHVFYYLGKAYEELGKYLIRKEHIYLSPNTLFWDSRARRWKVQLCYCPLRIPDKEGCVENITEYLLTVVDHTEDLVTRACYALYDYVHKEAYSMKEIQNLLSEYGKDQPNVEELQQIRDQEILISDRNPYVAEVDPLSDVPDLSQDLGCQNEDDNLYLQAPSGRLSIIPEEPGRLMRLKMKIVSNIQGMSERMHGKHRRKKPLVKHKETGPLIFDFNEMDEDDNTRLLSVPVLETQGETAPLQGMLVYEGSRKQDTITVDKDVISIGSNKDNDAVLEAGTVSRRHARIMRLRQPSPGYWLEDLNSLNGTKVKGEYLAPHQKYHLQAGDRVNFADQVFVMH